MEGVSMAMRPLRDRLAWSEIIQFVDVEPVPAISTKNEGQAQRYLAKFRDVEDCVWVHESDLNACARALAVDFSKQRARVPKKQKTSQMSNQKRVEIGKEAKASLDPKGTEICAVCNTDAHRMSEYCHVVDAAVKQQAAMLNFLRELGLPADLDTTALANVFLACNGCHSGTVNEQVAWMPALEVLESMIQSLNEGIKPSDLFAETEKKFEGDLAQLKNLYHLISVVPTNMHDQTLHLLDPAPETVEFKGKTFQVWNREVVPRYTPGMSYTRTIFDLHRLDHALRLWRMEHFNLAYIMAVAFYRLNPLSIAAHAKQLTGIHRKAARLIRHLIGILHQRSAEAEQAGVDDDDDPNDYGPSGYPSNGPSDKKPGRNDDGPGPRGPPSASGQSDSSHQGPGPTTGDKRKRDSPIGGAGLARGGPQSGCSDQGQKRQCGAHQEERLVRDVVREVILQQELDGIEDPSESIGKQVGTEADESVDSDDTDSENGAQKNACIPSVQYWQAGVPFGLAPRSPSPPSDDTSWRHDCSVGPRYFHVPAVQE
ncbi:hypothetical protein HMN09_00881000 [Mycena chlorophos]|uniref:HNH domain-containing protein n=1 Tax=Mycena chlorophos TaxID=658473 RepID=A0A8H6W7V2_MYCCL|nr:hypothetical protein HMN09_00881000 [Mycena chlorophos]